jgi:hypothetical protein
VSHRQWLPLLAMLGLAACELIVDFDADSEGMLTPTPIPALDGAVAVVVDGSAIGDGTVVRPPSDAGSPDGGDAGVRSDAGPSVTDAAAASDASDGNPEPVDANVSDAEQSDGAVTDAELDASPTDAAPDADSTAEASDSAADGSSEGDATFLDDASANGPMDPWADAGPSDAAGQDGALAEEAAVSDASSIPSGP